MTDTIATSTLDDTFEEALSHLARCRMAYEDDPRDPNRVDALGAARIRLDDARAAMSVERERLLRTPVPQPPRSPRRTDSEPLKLWQGVYHH